MSIVTTYNLMCEVCKKRIEVNPHSLEHTYSGLKIKDGWHLPENWIKLDVKGNHVCSNECFASHSAAQKVYGEDYLNNPACEFSW